MLVNNDNDNDNDINSSNSKVLDWLDRLDCSKLESQFPLGRKALGLMFNASSVTCNKTYLCYAWSKFLNFIMFQDIRVAVKDWAWRC